MFRLTAPGPRDLDAMLERTRNASLTHPETGATKTDALPAGDVHDRDLVELGTNTFEAASDGLRSWQAHIGANVRVNPADAPLRPGTDVVVMVHAGPLYALAPCRVVSIIDERTEP